MTDAAAKMPPKEPKETAVALKGLAPNTTEMTLRTILAAHGPVLRVKMDKLGGAHVVLASTRAAQRAAETANGAMVDGKNISAQHVRTFAKTTRPCRSFQEGKCRKGDACKYWHPTDGASSSVATTSGRIPTIKTTSSLKTPPSVKTTSTTAATTQQQGDDISGIPKDAICRNFSKGKCVQGLACRYAHVLGAGPLPPPAPASIPAQCSFFLAGRCSKGSECAFLHTDAPSLPPASKKTQCSYFAAGRCARGDQCAYLHEPLPASTESTAVSTKKEKKKKEAKTVKQPAPVVKPVAKKPTQQLQPVSQSHDSDRTCIECEKPGVVVWVCVSCDNAKYCDGCNALVHRAKVLRSHERAKLPPVVKVPTCGECENKDAVTKCEECDVVYCASCDATVHQFKSLRGHRRTPLATAALPVQSSVTPAKPQPQKTAEAYVESVPQYDISSESESDDDDEDDDEDEVVPPSNVMTRQPPAVEASSSESEDEEDEQSNAQSTATYFDSVPAYELPSDSDSSDDEDEDSDEDKKPPVAKPTSTPVAAAIDVSSESSDDDFEDERPRFSSGSTAQPAASVARTQPQAMSSESSSSESESDDEPMPSAHVQKRAAPASSSSSDDSSDEETQPPPAKQPRVAAPTVVKRPAPALPARAAPPAKIGISYGSSHSLVKKIEAYEASGNTEVLHLDPNLNGFERLLAHDCAERLGLNHVSIGEGLERHITISRKA